MGSVRAGTMGSVRSRRFSFSGFTLQRALARFRAAVVAPVSDTLWHHFLTRLGLLRRRGNNTLDHAPDTSTRRQQVRAFVPGPPLNAGTQPVPTPVLSRSRFSPRWVRSARAQWVRFAQAQWVRFAVDVSPFLDSCYREPWRDFAQRLWHQFLTRFGFTF